MDEDVKKKIKELEKRVKTLEDFLLNQPSFEDAMELSDNSGDNDEMYDMAVTVALQHDRVSASLLKRRLQIGFNRAVRLVEALAENGIIEPYIDSRPSKVLITPKDLQELSSLLEKKEEKKKPN